MKIYRDDSTSPKLARVNWYVVVSISVNGGIFVWLQFILFGLRSFPVRGAFFYRPVGRDLRKDPSRVQL